jgi:hypothetical protein
MALIPSLNRLKMPVEPEVNGKEVESEEEESVEPTGQMEGIE